jgi:hypothetical protein
VPKGEIVVLGSGDHQSGVLERKDALKRRIDH